MLEQHSKSIPLLLGKKLLLVNSWVRISFLFPSIQM